MGITQLSQAKRSKANCGLPHGIFLVKLKTIVAALLLLSFVVTLASCKQENSFENGLVAKGRLQSGVTGDCLPKKLNGIYKESITLTTTNTVEVTVEVTAPGSYSITTNTVNGYSFSGSGSFASAGTFVVTLQGSGKPILAGTDSFTVQFDSTVCMLPVTVIPFNTPPAVYTLVNGGTPPNCASAVVQGNYEKNLPVDASNYTEVKVNVTSPGTYTLTASGGGISFSASGVFTSTGIQSVRLLTTGTPIVQGVNNIVFAAPFNTCSFSLTVNGPAVYTIDCAAAVVNGSYVEQSQLDASHFISLPVNVTVPGYFKVTASTRGMTFFDSGYFAPGPQTILLKGTGAPNSWGTISLAVGSGGCYVQITVQSLPGSRLWRFTVGGVLYEGPINGGGSGSYNFIATLTLSGSSQSPSPGYNFMLTLTKIFPNGSSFPAAYIGTYHSWAPIAQGRSALRLSSNNGTGGFLADTANGNLTVNYITAGEGSFSGTVRDSTGAIVPLTNGYFRHQ